MNFFSWPVLFCLIMGLPKILQLGMSPHNSKPLHPHRHHHLTTLSSAAPPFFSNQHFLLAPISLQFCHCASYSPPSIPLPSATCSTFLSLLPAPLHRTLFVQFHHTPLFFNVSFPHFPHLLIPDTSPFCHFFWLKPGPNEDESWCEFKLSLSFDMELSCTLIDSHALSMTERAQIFCEGQWEFDILLFAFGPSWWLSMRDDENSHESQLLSTLILVWPRLKTLHSTTVLTPTS